MNGMKAVKRMATVLWLLAPGTHAAVVTLVASDTQGFSSFDSWANWSDGQTPQAGNDYETRGNAFLLPEAGGTHVFRGNSLKLNGGTFGGSTFFIPEGDGPITLHIADLTLSGNLLNRREGGATISGKMTVIGSDSDFSSGDLGSNSPLTITSTLSGGGVINLISYSSNSFIKLAPGSQGDFTGSISAWGYGLVDVLGDGAFANANSVQLLQETAIRIGGGVVHNYLPDAALLLFYTEESSMVLDFEGIDDVAQIFSIGKGWLAPGLYGAEDNPLAEFTDPHFRGTGLLRVVPEPGFAGVLSLAMGMLIFRRRIVISGT